MNLHTHAEWFRPSLPFLAVMRLIWSASCVKAADLVQDRTSSPAAECGRRKETQKHNEEEVGVWGGRTSWGLIRSRTEPWRGSLMGIRSPEGGLVCSMTRSRRHSTPPQTDQSWLLSVSNPGGRGTSEDEEQELCPTSTHSHRALVWLVKCTGPAAANRKWKQSY